MTIKEQLIEAGRLDAIRHILDEIMTTPDSDVPVNTYVTDDGTTKWRVNGDALIIEATALSLAISNNKTIMDIKRDDYRNLLEYVRSQSDMLLHNYANYIMHRKKPKIKPGKIRSYCILEHMINCIGSSWVIPSGWKKKHK